MSAPFVEIGDGHRLFVRDWGRGSPVLLLAGWGDVTLVAHSGAAGEAIRYLAE